MEYSSATLDSVTAVIVSTLGIQDRADTLTASTPLFGGMPELDSMAVVALAVALEREFGFEIDDEDFRGGEVFETIGTLAGFVEEQARNPRAAALGGSEVGRRDNLVLASTRVDTLHSGYDLRVAQLCALVPDERHLVVAPHYPLPARTPTMDNSALFASVTECPPILTGSQALRRHLRLDNQRYLRMSRPHEPPLRAACCRPWWPNATSAG